MADYFPLRARLSKNYLVCMRSFSHNMGPILSLRDVGLCFRQRVGLLKHRDFWALKNVSLDLYQGETLGVIGRNGAGKTSLLRVIAGVIAPNRGYVINHGYRASLLSLQLGFVPNLSGRDNVILSGLLLGLTRRQVMSKMEQIVEFAEIKEFIDQPIKTYSAGMKTRLGFSIAIQAEPDILLIDEILGVGDIDFRAKSSAVLQELIRSDKTVVIVSHQLDTIRSLCNRAVWVEDRKTRIEGEVNEVVTAYLYYSKSLEQQKKKLNINHKSVAISQ